MNHEPSKQVQVYQRVIKSPKVQIVEYVHVETPIYTPSHSQEYNFSPVNHHPLPPRYGNFEFSFALFLMILLPIFMCLSYRYGKRMGKMENGDSVLIKKRRVASQLIPEGPIEVLEGDRALLPVESTDSPVSNRIDSDNESQVNRKESNKSQEAIIVDESSKGSNIEKELDIKKQESSKERILEIESRQSSPSPVCEENRLISVNKEAGDDLSKFKVVMKSTMDKEGSPNALSYNCEEKLKLHTDDSQVDKKEVTVGLSFENRNGVLEKVETTEIRTVYAQGAEEPKNNALLVQQTYQNFRANSIIEKPLLAITDGKEGLKRSNSAGSGTTTTTVQTLPSTTAMTDLMSRVINSDKVIKPIEVSNEVAKITTKAAKAKDIEALIENDDLPHETGKFNKIFKDAVVIGEGSFGEVYKVVHKLDGKIYAVKKVKLRLAKFEDIQTKSKVFREVFAMTDLNHPNIVRYSTCWVELERKEKSEMSLTKQETISELPSEVSKLSESAQLEASKSVDDCCIKTSSVGFEWDLGGDESPTEKLSEKSLQDNKTALTHHIRDPSVLTGSLPKTFVKGDMNESSIVSNISKSEYYDYFEGHKLYLYIQMEYCSGQNLRNYLDTPGRRVCPSKILQMFRKILEGVNTIHKRGILHRDLKPANIFLDEKENVKIGDFGLASLDHTEESKDSPNHHHHHKKADSLHMERSLSKTVGTPMYTSPEQESGGRYNTKTDVYSLGFILCEMLAGPSTHHERYQLFNLLRRSHELPSQFLSEHPKESEIILKMTEGSPEERPNTEEVIGIIDKLIKESCEPQNED